IGPIGTTSVNFQVAASSPDLQEEFSATHSDGKKISVAESEFIGDRGSSEDERLLPLFERLWCESVRSVRIEWVDDCHNLAITVHQYQKCVGQDRSCAFRI